MKHSLLLISLLIIIFGCRDNKISKTSYPAMLDWCGSGSKWDKSLIEKDTTGLSPYIQRVAYINCSFGDNYDIEEQFPDDAAKIFYEKGWRNINDRILCPDHVRDLERKKKGIKSIKVGADSCNCPGQSIMIGYYPYYETTAGTIDTAIGYKAVTPKKTKTNEYR